LRFVSRWDARIIELFLGLKAKGVERPVITCYPPKFDPATFPRERSYAPAQNLQGGVPRRLIGALRGHQLRGTRRGLPAPGRSARHCRRRQRRIDRFVDLTA
jgi:hypothetical protein